MTEYAWHVHPGILIEALTEPIENRIEYIKKYIKKYKPIEQQELHLKLFHKVSEGIMPEFLSAWEECQKGIEPAWATIEELHKRDCPDCPWDGETIFSKTGRCDK